MSYELTVDPKIEMLGILEFFAHIHNSDFVSNNHLHPLEMEYQKKVEHYFEPFRDHVALHGLVKMKEMGFRSDQAVRLLLFHSQIPYMFSQPVIQNQKHLEWVQNLRLWIDDTKFPSFYDKNKSFYGKIMESVEFAMDQIPIFDLIELFFGEKRDSYHIIASSIKTGNHNVFLPNKGIAAIIGSPILGSPSIYPRIIHELAYCFIRPGIDLYWSHFQTSQESEKTSNQRESVYELIAQSIQAALIPGSVMEYTVLSMVSESIKSEYQKNRTIYPTFTSFLPHIAHLLREG
jgi:hypothetical protein